MVIATIWRHDAPCLLATLSPVVQRSIDHVTLLENALDDPVARSKGALRQELSNFGQELPRAVRFGHVRITPRLTSLCLVAAQGIGGHGDDRDRAQVRIRFDVAR